jgi:CRISPR-associated endonuclease Csn1
MEKVLGLDLGTNSIGWAIIERNEKVRLVDRGVHIFQEGVKIESGIESSKAADRTSHRSLRKHYWRRRARKVETLKILSDMGFCPKLSADQLKAWQQKGEYPDTEDFMAWQRTNQNSMANPYYYRYLAVNEKLDLSLVTHRYILGRALYHIAQRRGFLSNRLEKTKASEGEVKKSISTLSQEIINAGCVFLGEYFYQSYQSGKKIRNHYTSRVEHYKPEFDKICELQGLSIEDKKNLEKAIFFQRPLRSQKGLVGKCTFERTKPRCPVSHPRYEYYRTLCFLNNIRIKTPSDEQLRQLNSAEREKILPLFYRKSKENFDFEDIAKLVAGRGNYSYFKEPQGKPYLFNFKMNTNVSGSPVTAQLKDVFGADWMGRIERCYVDSGNKTRKQIINDIWHVLFSFDDEARLFEFAQSKLLLDEQKAKKFTNINIPQDYASLSLNAIDKIIPLLEEGLIYSHAVFLANLAKVVPKEIWASLENRKFITAEIIKLVDDHKVQPDVTIQPKIIDFLRDNFDLKPFAENKLYHPSLIETYPEVRETKGDFFQLESPRTNVIRNPMAMRALFQLRRLINQLLRQGRIDRQTKINIELSRELNNANTRKAIEQWQREIEKENKGYRDDIKQDVGIAEYEPNELDILKYRLWMEQNKICLYTGRNISVEDFIGANPRFDIEHTIPRSIGGDNSQMNKTLADQVYNREIKKARMPVEMANHDDILVRIEKWKAKIDELEKQIETSKKRRFFLSKEDKDKHITARQKVIIELRYIKGKYDRFIQKEVDPGFRNSQGVDAGIISKYARLYLQSLFPRVYSVKGEITAEFRKLWGLQDAISKKDRSNHVHHCIDAITIACIGKSENDSLSDYYRHDEEYHWGKRGKPRFDKPWATFTEDVKNVENELLVSHYTASNLVKQTKKKVRVSGKIILDVTGKPLMKQGDSARGSLHKETFYGAIRKGEEIKYVVRKSLAQLKDTDVEKIVDKAVREKVKKAIAQLGFKAAIVSTIWMNEQKGVPIKKVRCLTPTITDPLHIRQQRDQSRFAYKRQYHVANDGNFMMAVYEGIDGKGRTKRDFELVNNLEAAALLKQSAGKTGLSNLFPDKKGNLTFKCRLRIGSMVIFYENSSEEVWGLDEADVKKRLYKVIGLSTIPVGTSYGKITLLHHQEARPAKDLNARNGAYKCNEEYRAQIVITHNQLNALVQGFDFQITVLGQIEWIKS